MDKDPKRVQLESIIKRLRAVTLATQILPFAYATLYPFLMVAYLFVDEHTLFFLDSFFYVSPTVVVGMLVLSRMLKLCKWHRTTCLLPIMPQLSVILDETFVNFSRFAVRIHIITIIAMSILLLIAGYNIFFNGRR